MNSLSTNQQTIDNQGGLEELIQILGYETLRKSALAAMLDSGCFEIRGERLCLTSKARPSVVLGFVYESLIAHALRQDFWLRWKVFNWCTEQAYTQEEVYSGKGYKDINELLFSIKVICKGGNFTKYQEPQEYCPSCSNDIIFIVKNRLAMRDEVVGGFQIKAITQGEMKNIINPILQGKYQYVLTIFGDSYSRCMKRIQELVKKEQITQEIANSLITKIITAQNLGKDIELLCDWMGKKLYKFIVKGKKIENLQNQFLLDGAINYSLSELGGNYIYIPNVNDFIVPQPLIKIGN
ncbi:MAG: hypothetical protein Q4F05_19775 [bacterium]|nr:hypothetical protein [bacterium]